jgi:hypothetical protein
MSEQHRVRIDGQETVLTFDAFSRSRGYQYLTPGNWASHAFPWPLNEWRGAIFRLNGHSYEVLS